MFRWHRWPTDWDSSHILKCNIKAKRDGERGRERERERRGRGGAGRKSSSHLEGFQQAHTVTRVIRRNMPPVDRMMYSELRPKPEWYRGVDENKKERKKERTMEKFVSATARQKQWTNDLYLGFTFNLTCFVDNGMFAGLAKVCLQGNAFRKSFFFFSSKA